MYHKWLVLVQVVNSGPEERGGSVGMRLATTAAAALGKYRINRSSCCATWVKSGAYRNPPRKMSRQGKDQLTSRETVAAFPVSGAKKSREPGVGRKEKEGDGRLLC